MRAMKRWLLLVSTLVACTSVLAAEPVQVLVLGAYHMDNPGLDLHNAKVDDVLSAERQKQVRAVVEGLARFKPTRVAVEWQADSQPGHALPAYREYLAGKRKDSRNEIDQIGFRLAKRMQHTDAYGIDVAGEFPFEAVQAFAEQHGQAALLQQAMDTIAAKIKQFEQDQRTQSVAQLLRTMNDARTLARDHSWYMDALRYGAAGDQPGAKLVASWVGRNLQICARLMQIAEPGDRIVVLYGSGHGYLLRQCVQEIPGWKLVEANAYLPK
jgi:hypothetical protein